MDRSSPSAKDQPPSPVQNKPSEEDPEELLVEGNESQGRSQYGRVRC